MNTIGSRTAVAIKKRDLALRLMRDCGGSYVDAVLILCGVISGLAAQVWQGGDRERFVEVLQEFGPKDTTRISLPFLIRYLKKQQRDAERVKVETHFFDNPQCGSVDGDTVDKYEDEIIDVCESLSREELRAYSYANLLYKEIRSPYTHGYGAGSFVDSIPSQPYRAVTYTNWVAKPRSQETIWRIYFNPQWIGDVAVEVAKTLDKSTKTSKPSSPNGWWVDGGKMKTRIVYC